MSQPTVAEYTLTRLAQLGVDRLFGVPGDYAFPINDAAEVVPGLSWVGCANELNAAYAADGYARVRGAAILSTTYGVGELSALNGVMGSRAQRLPVFHLVGMPSERIQRLGLITHHNLGDTVYDRFQALSAAASGVQAVLTPANCVAELERVIQEALRQSRPAYVVISQMEATLPVCGVPVNGPPLGRIRRQQSVPAELEAAVAAILQRLETARHPVALVADLTRRYGLRTRVEAFLTRSNLPTALAPFDKGCIDDSLPQVIGLYAGARSSPAAVRERVEEADLVLDIGGLVPADLNTDGWTSDLDPRRRVTLHDDWVRAGDQVFLHTALEDVLNALVERVTPRPGRHGRPVAAPPLVGEATDPLSSATFYPRLHRHLRAGDTLLMETGTCLIHLLPLPLPKGVDAELQGLWGSIGWGTPACMGAAMAKTSGRAVLVTGDGAHQLTLNELAVMGRYGVKPVVFVLNNGLYGIEDVFSRRGHAYDDLPRIRYHLLPDVFGCQGWLTAQVATVQELEEALQQIDQHDGAAYIEVMIPEAESQPLPAAVIDRSYKLRTPSGP